MRAAGGCAAGRALISHRLPHPLAPSVASLTSSAPLCHDAAPLPGVREEEDAERWLERAYLVLSFLAHAAVWGESPPLTTLPATVAAPWCAVAARLGRRPILTCTHASGRARTHDWHTAPRRAMHP